MMIYRFIIAFLVCFSSITIAMDLELTQGINALLPMGIDGFGSDSQAIAFTDVIHHDLQLSGQFKLIQPSSREASARASFSTWQGLGADSVLFGELKPLGGGRYTVHVELADVSTKGRLLLARDYQSDTANLRRLAHHISDDVYQKLTGERGVFSTRIAYVLVQRRGEQARYSLDIADMDGNNPQSLVVSPAPLMSPAWSADGRQLAYVSFEKRRAQIFTVDVETGRRRLLTDFPGINGAPAWSPDGRQLAVVLSKGGNPKIYTVDLSTGSMKQLTFGDAIDTEPRFSPDGSSILFTSGRGGSPQVYRLNLASGAVARVTYDGNYNAKASYTPNQQQVVMLHREDRQFNIGVQQIGQSMITPLTDSSVAESPSVSPNGRLVLYATREHDQGILALVSLDGRVKTQFPPRDGDAQEPAWSPFLG